MRDALGREDGKGESVFTPEEVQALRDYAKNPEAFNAALREAARTTPQSGGTMKPVGEPDAGNRHVRFDERGWETERCRMAQATAPILDSTEEKMNDARFWRSL